MIIEAERTFQFDTIDDVVNDVAKGRIVIVTDDADRENEGDLVMAAEKVTPEAVNFMAMHGRGLICAPVSNEREEQLGLQRMVAQNREMYRTDFTVSVDAARGVTTGISAYDRATTILAIANPKSSPEDLNQPGHVFPLRAKDGGVLRRTGHTEAAVDLARMAGLQAAGVLCEILHDDGTMARLAELMEFRKKHTLRICTIQSLIAHRRVREKLVELEQIVKMPTDYGDFDLHLYRAKLDGQHHLALVKINCTRRCGKSRKKATAFWCTCGRKAAASGWPQKFTPTNCKRKDSIRWRQIPSSVTQAICVITASARKSSSILGSASSVF